MAISDRKKTAAKKAAGRKPARAGNGSPVPVIEYRSGTGCLEQNPDYYRRLVASAGDVIIATDSQVRIAVWNQGAEESFGYPAREVLGRPLTLIIPERYRKPFLEGIRHIKAAGQMIAGRSAIEAAARRKDGTEFPAEISITGWDCGEGTCFTVVLRDITERHRIGEALRDNRQVFKRTLDSLHDAVFIVDAETLKAVDCNPAACRMFGYQRDEIISKLTPFACADEADSIKFGRTLIAEIEEKGYMQNFEFVVKRKDGSTFPSEFSVLPLEEETGRPTRWVSVVRDITNRKQAEEKLRIKDSAIAGSQNAIAIADAAGKLTYVNQAYLKMWGYDDEAAVVGSELIFSPQKRVQRKVMTALQRGDSWAGEVMARRHDGSSFYVQLSAGQVNDENGAPLCIMASFLDITERKGLEQHLENRVKEISCLYAISRIAEMPGIAPDDLCREVAKLLRASLRFPESVYVLLAVFGKNYDTGNYRQSRWRQSVEVKVFGAGAGRIETGYTEETGWGEEGPFLREEWMLLEAVADWLGRYLERMQSEQAHRESEEKYRALVEVSPYGIQLSDAEGIITFSNPMHHRILGYDKGEIIGKHVWDFCDSEDDREYLKNYYRYQLLMQPVPAPYSGVNRTRDGRLINIRVDWNYMRDADGRLTGICSVISDITEKKRAEDALKSSEERLSAFMNSATDSFFQCDAELRLIEINENALAYLNQPREALLGRDIGEVLPVSGYSGRREQWLDIIRYDRPFYSEEEVRFPETGRRELALKVFKVGRGLGLIQTDITEQRRADDEARQFKIISDTANHGVVITDADGVITYINPYFAAMHGYQPDELTGRNISILHNQEQIAAAETLYRRELRIRGSFSAREVWHTHKDGPVFPVLMNGAVIPDARGKPLFMAFTAMDITERKAVEEESQFKAQILDAATDSIFVQDLDGNFIYLNETAHRSHGYEHDEMLAMNVLDIEVNPAPKAIRARVKGLQKKGEISFAADNRRKDGSVLPVEVNARLVKLGDKKYILSIVRDITERKLWERRLQDKSERLDNQNEELISQREELIDHRLKLLEKTKQLEEASRAKSAFLASMSHELRTPLNAIIGFSELMLDGVIGELNGEQRQCLDDVLGSGEHLLTLINDVLDLTKIEAGRVDLKPEKLAAAGVISEVIQVVKPLLERSRHRLDTDIASSLPAIRADRYRLKQVLLNLLSNAIKFTPPGGLITVKAGQRRGHCRISVIDNGVGIKEADQERMFEAFAQGDTLPDKQKEGTGLGLKLSRQFVEMMGGEISVSSRYGQGSAFTFTVPLAETAVRRHNGDGKKGNNGGGDNGNGAKRILLVDDDASARHLLKRWLEPEGYAVSEAADGESGLRMAGELKPALLVLDIIMPDLTGFEVITRLKRIAALKDIPVIALTSLDLSAGERETLRQGTRKILQKASFRRRDFLKEIETIMADCRK